MLYKIAPITESTINLEEVKITTENQRTEEEEFLLVYSEE